MVCEHTSSRAVQLVSPVRTLKLPRDTALVTILRGGRVIVPEADDPFEGEDELLFVTSPEGEEELRAALASHTAAS